MLSLEYMVTRMIVFRIDVYKAELLANVVPESMLSWARARLSNLLATSGESWAQTFSFLHSGTYVNQWMVMDLAKFSPGKDPQEGFLTVLEEVPGYIHSEDLTQRLIVSIINSMSLYLLTLFAVAFVLFSGGRLLG